MTTTDLPPKGELALRTQAMLADTNAAAIFSALADVADGNWRRLWPKRLPAVASCWRVEA
jgi:hypothetical protein